MVGTDNDILYLQAPLAEDSGDSGEDMANLSNSSLDWNEDNSRELTKSFQSAYSIEIHSMTSFMGALNYGFPDLVQDWVGPSDPLTCLLPPGNGPVHVIGGPVSGLRADLREERGESQRGVKRSECSLASGTDKKSKTLSYKNDGEKGNFPLKEKNEENLSLEEKARMEGEDFYMGIRGGRSRAEKRQQIWDSRDRQMKENHGGHNQEINGHGSGSRQPFMDLTNAAESISMPTITTDGESNTKENDAEEEDPNDINAIFSIRAMFRSLKKQHKVLRF